MTAKLTSRLIPSTILIVIGVLLPLSMAGQDGTNGAPVAVAGSRSSGKEGLASRPTIIGTKLLKFLVSIGRPAGIGNREAAIAERRNTKIIQEFKYVRLRRSQ